MIKFFARRNKDAANDFVCALLEAGYLETSEIRDADFLLLDHDWTGEWSQTYRQMLAKMPKFIYPHTPYSYFLYDGICEATPVLCNFVVGDGALQTLKAIKYPYRFEAIGFTGCKVQEFTPTTGTRLLFAPAHPVHDGKHPIPENVETIRRAALFIRNHLDCFESVTLRYAGSLETSGLECLENTNINFEQINPYAIPNIREQAIQAIRKADIVITQNTFGFLSIATGKPTVMYGYKGIVPHSREGRVSNYRLYRQHFEFPLQLEDMGIEDVLNVRHAKNDAVEFWKSINIGSEFDKEKFIRIVKEYV